MSKYEYWQSPHNREWWWRYRAANGKEIARSSEGYDNKADCLHSIGLMKASKDAPVVEAKF
jgi:uncharacterized protein YegP (UPF0339 family)